MTTQDVAAYRRELRARRRARTAGDVLAALEGKLFATVPEAAVVLRSDERSVRRSIEAGDIPLSAGRGAQARAGRLAAQAAGLETSEAGH